MSNPRVTGAIRYAQDVELEGMLQPSILRSPYPYEMNEGCGSCVEHSAQLF